MLSSVLNSDRAIEVNIAIMRIFTNLRSFLVMESSVEHRLTKIESKTESTQKLFKIVFKRLDTIEDQVTPHLPKTRKKIGLQPKKE